MILSIIKYIENIFNLFTILRKSDLNIESIKDRTGLNTDTLFFITALIFGFILGTSWSYVDKK